MAALGMPQDGGYSAAEWKALTADKAEAARAARLTHMVAEGKVDGPGPSAVMRPTCKGLPGAACCRPGGAMGQACACLWDQGQVPPVRAGPDGWAGPSGSPSDAQV